jgi:hypothetical protein
MKIIIYKYVDENKTNQKKYRRIILCIFVASVQSDVYLGIMPECHCPENHSFLRMAIWPRGLERWYLVLGGVAVGLGFEPQSYLELSFAKILI